MLSSRQEPYDDTAKEGALFMKILLTTDWFTPAVNGVVTSVLNLRKGLEERGHEVRILTLSHSSRSYVQDSVYYICSMGIGAVYPNARVGAAIPLKILKELLFWKPDIVHSNCEFSTFPAACHIAEKANAPLLHTYHTVYENYTHYFSPSRAWRKVVARHFSRWVARRTDSIIAPTEKTASLLRGYGICCPLYIIPTGISSPQAADPEETHELRSRLGIAEGQTVLLFLGRLAREKNCAELLRFMSRLYDFPVTLLLVGDGPERGPLEKLSPQLHLEKHVIFAGMVPPERVGHYYQLGDLFVSASTSETQGLTYMEALGAGVPLLCRRDACLDGVVIQGANGWQYTNEAEFAARAEEFIIHTEYREHMKSCARAAGLRFSVASFAQEIESAYIDCLRSHKQRERGSA